MFCWLSLSIALSPLKLYKPSYSEHQILMIVLLLAASISLLVHISKSALKLLMVLL